MHMYVLAHIISIQFAGSPQVLAETVATITNDFMSFEPSDVSVTATLIGNLTQDAVQDSEVLFLIYILARPVLLTAISNGKCEWVVSLEL